jgi:hypothetical protein
VLDHFAGRWLLSSLLWSCAATDLAVRCTLLIGSLVILRHRPLLRSPSFSASRELGTPIERSTPSTALSALRAYEDRRRRAASKYFPIAVDRITFSSMQVAAPRRSYDDRLDGE